MIRAAVIVALLGALPPPGGADSAAAVERLLAEPGLPGGVAFEIMTFEDHGWRWAAPLLRRSVDRLRARHPGLDIALVAHGAELFELTLPRPAIAAADLRLLEGLHGEGVSLHVDGAYARWKRLDAADFPAFVDLAPSAAALLEDYRALGFEVIRLVPPHATD